MTCLQALAALGSTASIATACVALYWFFDKQRTNQRRVRELETLLATKSQPNDDSLTVQQLAIALTLTEDQVIEAASRSKKIQSWAGQSGKEYRFKMIRN
jgi:hypothetical protein